MSQKPQPFLIVNQGDTLWKIVANVFGLTHNAQIAENLKKIERLNPHIKNLNEIKEGQVIFLGSPTGIESFAPSENDLREMEYCFVNSTKEERNFLIDQWEIISAFGQDNKNFFNTVSYNPTLLKNELGNPANVEVTNNTFSFVPSLSYKTGKTTGKTARLALEGKFGNFLKTSPFVWSKLEGELVQGLKKQIQYMKTPDGSLRLIPKNTRAFNLNKKIILISRENSGYKSFSNQVKKSKAAAKVLKTIGTVTKIVDFGLTVNAIREKWDTKDRERTIATEGSKYAAGLAWGSGIGEAASLGVCGVLTLTTGVGGLVCFGGVFLAGGILFSELGSSVGEKAYQRYEGSSLESYFKNSNNSLNDVPWLYQGMNTKLDI